MKGIKLDIVENESQSWIGFYIDNLLAYSGKKDGVDTLFWAGLINENRLFSETSVYFLKDEYVEGGLPVKFSFIPDDAF